MAKAIKNLQTFMEYGLPDLRSLDSKFRRNPIAEIEQAKSLQCAVALLEFHMGFIESDVLFVPKVCPLGFINIVRSNLKHIVEKRRDARERYVLLALDTLENPYEIWETMYDDDMVRYVFIGTYSQERQMLVVVAPWDGRVLWNFFHTNAKTLNKHRQGNLLYKRY